MVLEDSFSAQSVLQDFLSLIMRHWNVIADTLHSSDVFLPLLLEDQNGTSHANDWAKGFLRGMELRNTDWAALLNDEKRGGWIVPIFALAHEHNADPEMRPYKKAISTEERKKLIVGAAAGVTGIYRYFEAQRLIERDPFDSATTFRRTVPKIGRRIRVHVDRERNSSSAAVRPRSIKTTSIYRCTAIWGAKLTYSTSPKRWDVRRSDRALLCAQSATVARDGKQLAELWRRWCKLVRGLVNVAEFDAAARKLLLEL